MSELKNVESTARPLRVAYLVDLENCPPHLLDAIFAECYSRWGGRRSLIVPARADTGIHDAYKAWLYLYDADILYSYVDFTDALVEKIHEEYCPLYLVRHDNRNGTADLRACTPNLPLGGLSPVSLLPLLLSRRGLENFSDSKIIDCDHGLEAPRFFTDNFGSFYTSFHNSITAEQHPELYKALTLISEASLNNPRRGRSDSREYETTEHAILSRLTNRTDKILTLSMLSDYLSMYLDFHSRQETQSFNLVVGDTAPDRILFWNFHQHYLDVGVSEIVGLSVDPTNLGNEERLDDIVSIIKNRSRRSHAGYPITLRSFSQTEAQLNSYAEQLRKKIPHAQINVQVLARHEDYMPNMNTREDVRFRTGMTWNEPRATVKSSYSGERIEVPEVLPIHMSDVSVPASLRAGIWMLDIKAERQLNHSKVSNISHIWCFPRRVRIDRQLQRLDNYNHQDHYLRTIRVNRHTLISIPVKKDMELPVFKFFEDGELISRALVSRYDWAPFRNEGANSICCRKRYVETQLSNEGRYFQGVMQHFGSITQAEQILLHKFWYQVFVELGADGFVSEQNIDRLSGYVGRRVQGANTTNFLQDEGQRRNFSKKCLVAALGIAREKQFIPWNRMLQIWEAVWENFINANEQLQDRAEEIKKDDLESVEESVQLLCQKKILFQGQQWTCRVCLHKNWESIENLRTTLVCEVCGNSEPAPIANDWKFKLNEFVLDAMRQHGTIALIWCLIQISNRAQASFNYAPSMKLMELVEDTEVWTEVDLLAVVDGDCYVCEVKTSPRVTDTEIAKFASAVNKLRPDIALFAVMEEGVDIQTSLNARIAPLIDEGIKLEILPLHQSHFDDDARLPNGRSFLMRVF